MTTEQQIEKEADDYCQVNNGLKIKDYNIELRRIHKAYIAGRTKGIDRERELEDRLFTLGEMNKPPCFCCGYNGEGYYQPEKHPCAERHHKLLNH